MIQIVCGDYALDPEIEEQDLEDICNQCRDHEVPSFTVEINEDGIEIEIPEN